MERKSLKRVIILSSLGLLVTGLGVLVSKASGFWVFDNTKNEVADVGDITIPEWTFDNIPDINDVGYYDEFGNKVENIDRKRNYLTFSNTYLVDDGVNTNNSPIAINYFTVHWVQGHADFQKVEFPAYYAERVNGELMIHPVTEIGTGYTFPNYISNYEAVIAPTVTTIGSKAFYYAQLRGISFTSENNIERIESNSFVGVRFDRSATPFGPKLNYIGSYAFYNCSFDYIDLNDIANLETINYGAFYNCSARTIDLSNSNIGTIGNIAFQYCRNATFKMDNLKVKIIGENAFNGDSLSGHIDLRDSGIERIEAGAFSYLTTDIRQSLTISIPGTIDYIGDSILLYSQGNITVNLYDLSYETESNFHYYWDYTNNASNIVFNYLNS
ncbi:MAG: leucine-rich repeat domain-containing protein [Bacilli bacterium]|jgi:hypothetical protein